MKRAAEASRSSHELAMRRQSLCRGQAFASVLMNMAKLPDLLRAGLSSLMSMLCRIGPVVR
jgi:hypothetical protein